MQAVQSDLAACLAYRCEEARIDRVVVGDEVPRGSYAVPALDLDHSRDVFRADRVLDVVRENEREALALRPEVDERDSTRSSSRQLRPEALLEPVHQQRLDRPGGESAAKLGPRIDPWPG